MEDEAAPSSGPGDSSADWRRLESDVLATVRKHLGRALRRRLESMDVVQDVMAEVLEEREKQLDRQVQDFGAWVHRVVRNRIVNLARFHSARQRDPDRAAESTAVEEVFAATADPAVLAEAHQLVELLYRALGRMSEQDQLLVVLRKFRELPWDAVALQSGHASPDAARMAFNRVMGRLTRELSG